MNFREVSSKYCVLSCHPLWERQLAQWVEPQALSSDRNLWSAYCFTLEDPFRGEWIMLGVKRVKTAILMTHPSHPVRVVVAVWAAHPPPAFLIYLRERECTLMHAARRRGRRRRRGNLKQTPRGAQHLAQGSIPQP